MPPTIFLLSLGGVVVILARGVVRMRRADFSASVKSVAVHGPQDSLWGQGVQSTDADVLRPTQKSVQVIKSRAGLILAWLKMLNIQIKNGILWLKARPTTWRKNHPQRAAKTNVRENTTTSTESVNEQGLKIQEPKQKMHEAAHQLLHFSSTSARAARQGLLKTAKRVRAFSSNTSRKPNKSINDDSIINELRAQPDSSATQSHTDEPIIPNTSNNIRTRIIEKISPDKPSLNDAKKTAIIKRHKKHQSKTKATPIQQARQAFADKSYAHAENILVNHIVNHTKDTNAYMLLGEIACAKENYSEAVEIFEQIITWNPETKDAYANLGMAAFQDGRYGRALQALQRAHDADPDNQEVLSELLVIAKRMDNPALQHSIEEKLAARQKAHS